MSFQVFKSLVPTNLLFNLLDKICTHNDKYYTIDYISYKKADYLDLLSNFYKELLPYYYTSKQYYITRKSRYNSFITILRQICKQNNLHYISKIKYSNSKYEIIYYIYREVS
jgi:hypothetical protein